MTSAAVLEEYRPALMGHCYRMLGSLMEAEDAVQETMLRAWKALDRVRDRSSFKPWLYRIATNVCFDTLAATHRTRVRPMDVTPGPTEVIEGLDLTQREREYWVEPIPDALALPNDGESDPAEQAILRESIRLAFVAALQYLPPRQRAVLLLTQVLNWSANETAEALEMSVPAVNSALQRARATLEARNPAVVPRDLTPEQERLLERYASAFERYDVEAIAQLLHEEATMSMPPYELWLKGRDSIARWMLTYGIGCRGSRLVRLPTACGGAPAFAQYRQGGDVPWGIVVLDLDGDRIVRLNYFLDVEKIFPRFDMPMRLA